MKYAVERVDALHASPSGQLPAIELLQIAHDSAKKPKSTHTNSKIDDEVVRYGDPRYRYVEQNDSSYVATCISQCQSSAATGVAADIDAHLSRSSRAELQAFMSMMEETLIMASVRKIYIYY